LSKSAIFHIKGLTSYEFVSPKQAQSIKHSAFKFWNVYGNAFVKEYKILGWTSEFCFTSMHLPL
jgi:hypothetical protein